ncbi:hypothetical protein EJ08DRAFT_697234 [Tothia fuscella]|uniref:Uncharacterized protein n=1 Tax=Tothia fuscella TaxID=1048955 RepID=A0A9P4NRT3_9PEZI|nr:hypothetical protein EJ08DRAFT_697234 [Tothia fuscella]
MGKPAIIVGEAVIELAADGKSLLVDGRIVPHSGSETEQHIADIASGRTDLVSTLHQTHGSVVAENAKEDVVGNVGEREKNGEEKNGEEKNGAEKNGAEKNGAEKNGEVRKLANTNNWCRLVSLGLSVGFGVF